MQNGGRPSRVTALFLSSHPGPSFAVTAITILLCAAVGLDGWRTTVVGLAVLFGQFSVGLGNDWLDADRDRRTQRHDKPVALGHISPRAVRAAAILTGIVGLALPIAVGWKATLAHGIFVSAGWLYNIALKRTVFSVLPYVIGFGALPAIATLALAAPTLPKVWVVGTGALLGVAAHFANALPDLEADRATGVIGLPHRLGARASTVVTFCALAAATALIVFWPAKMPDVAGWLILAAEAAVVGVGIVLGVTGPPSRWLFRLVIFGALIAVAALALTGASMLAA